MEINTIIDGVDYGNLVMTRVNGLYGLAGTIHGLNSLMDKGVETVPYAPVRPFYHHLSINLEVPRPDGGHYDITYWAEFQDHVYQIATLLSVGGEVTVSHSSFILARFADGVCIGRKWIESFVEDASYTLKTRTEF
jgi:hypothetical protein